jgi:hypothetical protein
MAESAGDQFKEYAQEAIMADKGELAVGKFLVDLVMFPFRFVGRMIHPPSQLSQDFENHARRAQTNLDVSGEFRDLNNRRNSNES